MPPAPLRHPPLSNLQLSINTRLRAAHIAAIIIPHQNESLSMLVSASRFSSRASVIRQLGLACPRADALPAMHDPFHRLQHREPSTSCPRINRSSFAALMPHPPTAEILPLVCNQRRETTFVSRPASILHYLYERPASFALTHTVSSKPDFDMTVQSRRNMSSFCNTASVPMTDRGYSSRPIVK